MSKTASGVIEQFVGGRILRAGLIPPEDPTDRWQQTAGLWLEVQLGDGSDRELAVYTLTSSGRQVHIRVDGMFVPPEELPPPRWLNEDGGTPPRDKWGRVHWDRFPVQGITEVKRFERRDLPLWVQELLRLLRQELELCRRALEHRNARLREMKGRLRLLHRLMVQHGNFPLAHAIARAGLWRGFDLNKPPLGEEPHDDHATD